MNLPKNDNPIEIAQQWLEEAKKTGIREPTAAALATSDAKGSPSLRMVLIKQIDENGFVFYTNLDSKKSHDIIENPRAAFCLYWMELGKQVRIEGRVEAVTEDEADRYFASREYLSRIGAWASKQSKPLEGRFELEKRAAKFMAKYKTNPPRPPFWSGYRVVPDMIELWEEKPFRMHERRVYRRSPDTPDGPWESTLLYP